MASEKHRKELLEILQLPGNGECADCGTKDPEWASINLGVFVCIECSGVHRNLGTHISKVRSLRLDVWTDELVRFMRENGNTKGNEAWAPKIPVFYPRIFEGDPKILREQFIRAKYERKEFCNDSKDMFDVSSFPTTPLKVGYLSKKGKENSKYLPRYLVLKDQLYYYKKNNEPKELGIVDLKNSKIIFAGQKTGKNLSIHIVDSTNDRNYYFIGENSKEIMDWFCAFRLAKALVLGLDLNSITNRQEFSEKIDISILIEGNLSKKANPKSSYQKRWCILESKTLVSLKDSLSPYPIEKTVIGSYKDGYQVTENEEQKGDGYNFVLHAPATALSFGSGGGSPNPEGVSGAIVRHYFEADSKAEKTKWIEAIESIMKRS